MPPPRPPALPPPPATRKRSNAVTAKGARPPPPQAPTFRRSETDGDEFHDLKRRRSESSRAYAPALRQRANATLKAKTRARRSAPSNARPSPLNVYVFGYCHREGQRGSRAGYGVYIEGTTPTDTARNVSVPVSLYTKQTSNVASLLAVEAALETPLVRRASRRTSDVRVVVHVDDPYTLSMLTYKGAELEAQGYPPRANHLLVARVRKAFVHTVRTAKHHPVLLPIDLDDAAHAEGYGHARRLAKTAVERLRDTPLAQGGEQEWYYLQDGCAYDDTKRMRLTVPTYDRAYALSKGAWWDWEEREWYTYGPQDLGVHYDMTGVDFRNLMCLYGGGDGGDGTVQPAGQAKA